VFFVHFQAERERNRSSAVGASVAVFAAVATTSALLLISSTGHFHLLFI